MYSEMLLVLLTLCPKDTRIQSPSFYSDVLTTMSNWLL